MADEVWLDVLPSMRGFGADLVRKATGAARDAGGKAGKEYSRAFEKGSGNAADKAVSDLEVSQKRAAGLVSKLSGQVSTARQSQKRSAAELLMAEQRLADATEKYGEDSNQAQAAALRLEAARDKAAGATQKYESAEKGLKEAQGASKIATEQLEKAQAGLTGEVKKAPGLWGKLKSAIGDTDASANRTRATLDRFKSGAIKVGKGIGWAGAAVGAFGATVAGFAIKGGIDRALNIEDARASMSGLGHDTKTVDGIMQNALASVKGTSYGLGDAATIASTAVAAGIKPGEKLERILKLTANTASIARVGLDEMGGVLNKVWTSGKVGTEELNQIADRGIPIWTKLASHYGVNADELRKMVSKGTVDAETFADVLEGTVGNAADSMGKTTRGMWANLKSAMSRGGEVIAGPFLKVFRDGMAKAIPAIDSVVTSMKPFMESIGEKLPGILSEIAGGFTAFVASFQIADGDVTSSGFPGFMERLGYAAAIVWDILANKLVPALVATGEWIQRNKDWLVPLIVTVGSGALAWKLYDMAVGGVSLAKGKLLKIIPALKAGLMAVNTALRANPIGIVVTLVGALVGAFIYLWNTNEGFRNFFISAWDKIKDAVGSAVDWIKGALDTLGGFFGGVWQRIKDTVGGAVNGIKDATSALGGVFTSVWRGIKDSVGTAVGFVQDVVGNVVGFFRNTVAPMFVWFYESIIKPIWTVIATAITIALVPIVASGMLMVWLFKNVIAPAAVWLYEKVIKPIFKGIQTVIGAVVWAVQAYIGLWVGLFKNILAPAFMWVLNSIVIPVMNAIKSGIAGMWTAVKGIFTSMNNFIRSVLASAFTWFRDSVITPVWNGIKSVISTAWTNIKTTFQNVINFVRGVLTTAFTWFRDSIIKPIWNTIKSIISTAWTNIKETFQNVINFVRGVLTTAFTWFRDSIIKPVWNGIKSAISSVWNTGIKPVFEALGNFIRDKVAPVFQKGVDKIKGIWDSIKEFAKKPISFVINTVINDGLIAAFNKVAGWIPGVKKLDKVKVPGFAGGGWTGPGARNDWAGDVHADEFVVQKKSRRTFERDNPGFLDHVNTYGRAPGYANGGLVHPMGPGNRGVSAGWQGYKNHMGTDYPAPVGTPVHSPGPGVVAQTGWNLPGGTGRQVWINHDNGLLSRVHHLSEWLVSAGQRVNAGQAVGRVGMTGNTTGPHAHWGVMDGSRYLNPATVWGSGVGGSGGFYEGGGGGFNPLSFITDAAKKLVGQFADKFPGGGQMIDIAKGTGTKLFTDVKEWVTSKLNAAGDLGRDIGSNVKDFFTGKGGTKKEVQNLAMPYGWGGGDQWKALRTLIQRESSWNPNAANKSSSARGLFQKMTSLHGPIESTVAGQAKWGLDYIKGKYGNPMNALSYHNRHNSYAEGGHVGVDPTQHTKYDNGGVLAPGTTTVVNRDRKPEAIYNHAQNKALQTLAARGAQNTEGISIQIVAPEQATATEYFSEAKHQLAVMNRRGGRG